MKTQYNDAVYVFCQNIIECPRVIEFQDIRNLMSSEARRLNVNIPESHYKNLLRKMSSKFSNQLNFVHYQHNKVLVYPGSLKVEDLVIQNYELNRELLSVQSTENEPENSVCHVAQLLHREIKSLPQQMTWPPQEKELETDKIESYIPYLLNVFYTVLISGKSTEHSNSKVDRVVRLKNYFAQDVVYAVSNETIKTPKSVLFPSVIK